jgi:hypothetical protein
MRGWLRIALAATSVAMLAAVVMPALALADSGTAKLRLVYLSSDSPNVDFYVDGNKAWSNVGYKTISNYTEVSAAAHTYAVRKAGAAPDSQPMAQVQQTLNADGYFSVVAAGKFEDMQAKVITDAATSNPPPGYCQARFLQASPTVPAVDVVVTNPNVVYPNITFMNVSDYVRMPAGIYDIELRQATPDHKGTTIFTIKNFNADGGHIHTLSAAGGVGRTVELVEMYDSVSAVVTPSGAAETGGGGLFFHGFAWLPLVLLPLALGGVALLLVRRPPQQS